MSDIEKARAHMVTAEALLVGCLEEDGSIGLSRNNEIAAKFAEVHTSMAGVYVAMQMARNLVTLPPPRGGRSW